MKKLILITGVCGGLGKAFAERLMGEGYSVLGVDIVKRCPFDIDHYIVADLSNASTSSALDELVSTINRIIDEGGYILFALVNNAAVQVLGKLDELTVEDMNRSLSVNLMAPFILCQRLRLRLSACNGSIVNIGSIHSKMSKRNFAAYAISKSALSGLHRSLSLEFSNEIKVILINPAAMDTEMLKEGFKDSPELLDELAEMHPAGALGQPGSLASLLISCIEANDNFISGAVINYDGGISSRLHDPF